MAQKSTGAGGTMKGVGARCKPILPRLKTVGCDILRSNLIYHRKGEGSIMFPFTKDFLLVSTIPSK